MKTKTVWLLAIVLGLAALFFLPSLMLGRFGGGGYGGMMGSGMMGRGFSNLNPMGIFGFGLMGLMWLFPLGLLALLAAGAAMIWNAVTRKGSPAQPAAAQVAAGQPSEGRNCPACGNAAQADWATCPYCGKPLE